MGENLLLLHENDIDILFSPWKLGVAFLSSVKEYVTYIVSTSEGWGFLAARRI